MPPGHWRLFPRDAGIRTKLIAIFVAIKVLPLVLLTWLLWQGVQQLGAHLGDKISAMGAGMRETAGAVGKLAVDEATAALDRQAQEAIERQTVVTAAAVADFLYSIDRDLNHVASLAPDEAVYRRFLNARYRDVPTAGVWRLNEAGDEWVPLNPPAEPALKVEARLADNARAFNYRPPDDSFLRETRPVFLELTFIDLQGREQIKLTTDPDLPTDLRDVSDPRNTWVRAETYFQHLPALDDGEIYVSEVIGAYVGSPIIGPYTPQRAAEKKLPFEPQRAAYAGRENPVGQRFRGLVRWARPVLRDGQRIGYVTLALDHAHLMAFTDHLLPTSERHGAISDASRGNYAFMWDHQGRNISHPRDYFIAGFDPQTGQRVAPWLDSDTFQRWQDSGLSAAEFLAAEPQFLDQSLQRKPALAQIGRRELALDCRHLNFAPQCSGWWNLTRYGGSGSFEIFWSGLWKLTTAAAIPYYTGLYGQSPRGFGFVTIGANVHEFHQPAAQAATRIDAILQAENQALAAQQQDMQAWVESRLQDLLYHLSLTTLAMVLAVIAIGIWMAHYLTRRIRRVLDGLERFQDGELDYRLDVGTRDEMGQIASALNHMGATLGRLIGDLRRQVLRRQRAEESLAQSNRQLEETVERRTQELKETNRRLLLENEERSKAEQRMKLMAQYDDLTGLANRTLFRDQLQSALAQASRADERVGLMFIDLDKFKEVNDTLGHGVGDALLVAVARALRECTRGGDTVARLGGDEFAMVLCRTEDSDQLAAVAQRLIDRLTGEFEVRGHRLSIGCSIGIAMFPDDTVIAEDLVRHADVAMYQAKAAGGNAYKFFIAEMQRAVEQHKALERELKQALAEDQLVLHYQPRLRVGDGEIIGVEALVRWQHPQRGLLPPAEFVPFAEHNGLIVPLGAWVLHEACRQNRAWQDAGLRPLRMAVNLSAVQLREGGVVGTIQAALRESGLAPEWLEIELTETTAMDNQAESARVIEAIKHLGVSVSIDDFGTGYSSFQRLKWLAFDAIKIDRSFIHGIGDANDDAVVRAIISMAHTLNVELVAEGVETEAQWHFLRNEGCDQLQGFYFSRPLAAEQILAQYGGLDEAPRPSLGAHG